MIYSEVPLASTILEGPRVINGGDFVSCQEIDVCSFDNVIACWIIFMHSLHVHEIESSCCVMDTTSSHQGVGRRYDHYRFYLVRRAGC